MLLFHTSTILFYLFNINTMVSVHGRREVVVVSYSNVSSEMLSSWAWPCQVNAFNITYYMYTTVHYVALKLLCYYAGSHALHRSTDGVSWFVRVSVSA